MIALDVKEAIVEDREIAQPQEIHLEKPGRFAGSHIKLSDDRSIRFATMDWNNFKQRLFTQDHASGMHSPLTLEAFQTSRGIDNALSIGIGLIDRSKLTGLAITIILWIKYSREGDVLTHNCGR